MATTINWGSIRSKIDTCVGRSKAVGENAVALAAAAGDAFASHLSSQISSSGLSAGAVAAVAQPTVGGVSQASATTATVTVSINGESRPSLAPDVYGGIDNMGVLLNDGYHAGGAVRGEWHGNTIWSRTSFEGAHFIESAIGSFPAASYHVISIVRGSG